MTDEKFHEAIKQEAKELANLLIEKNLAYGNSYANTALILKILYPRGVTPEQYSDMLAIASRYIIRLDTKEKKGR